MNLYVWLDRDWACSERHYVVAEDWPQAKQFRLDGINREAVKHGWCDERIKNEILTMLNPKFFRIEWCELTPGYKGEDLQELPKEVWALSQA